MRKLILGIVILSGIILAGCDSLPTESARIATVTGRPEATSRPIFTPPPSLTPPLTPTPTPTFTPTPTGGGLIAYVSERNGNTDIYVARVGAPPATRLTDSINDDQWPSWSPDGKKIAYVSRVGRDSAIYVIDLEGGNPNALIQNPENGFPSWSPDGQTIAFFAFENHWALYTMSPNGDNPTRLTGNTIYYDLPVWSPDGSKIVYTAMKPYQEADIYVANVDGSDPTQLTFEGHDDFDPAWSPDGQWIAFTSLRDGIAQVYLMRPDGADQHALTSSPGGNGTAAWSPDGKRIVFISRRDEAHLDTCQDHCDSEIYVMDADGNNQIRLTDNAAQDYAPAWSPDGSYIAFVSLRDESQFETCADRCNSEIYVMDITGNNLVRVTFNEQPDSWPVWQPSPNSTVAAIIYPTPGPTATPIPVPVAQITLREMQLPTAPISNTLSMTGPWLFYNKVNSNKNIFSLAFMNIDGSGDTLMPSMDGSNFCAPHGGYLANLYQIGIQIYHLPDLQVVATIPVAPEEDVKQFVQDNPGAYFSSDMLWSPDGRYLAYTARTEGPTMDVYVFDTLTLVSRRLTDGPTYAHLIDWSPDSQWIIHTGWGGSDQADFLWAANVDGSEVRVLETTSWVGGTAAILTWITSHSFAAGTWSGSYAEDRHISYIRTIDIDSSQVSMLFEDAYEDAAVDPETNTILLISGVFYGEETGLFIYHPGDPAPTLVDARTWEDVRWIPELRLFAAEWNYNGEERMVLVSPDGEISIRFPYEAMYAPIPSPDGQWVAFLGKNIFGQQGIRIYDQNGNWIKHILPDFVSADREPDRILYWKPDSSGFWLIQEIHSDPDSSFIWNEYQTVIEYSLVNDQVIQWVNDLDEQFDFFSLYQFILP